MECRKKKNLEICPCSYPNCPRKGTCCQCLKYHRKNGEFPACFFPKKSRKHTIVQLKILLNVGKSRKLFNRIRK